MGHPDLWVCRVDWWRSGQNAGVLRFAQNDGKNEQEQQQQQQLQQQRQQQWQQHQHQQLLTAVLLGG
jgi:hypothetical protein